MKRINSVAFAVCLITLLACKKDRQGEQDRFSYLSGRNAGTITASINGTNWASNICLVGYDKERKHIYINAMVFADRLEIQRLSIAQIDLKNSVNRVHSAAYYRSLEGSPTQKDTAYAAFFLGIEDATENTFYVLDAEASQNNIIIDSYDSVAARVKGRFSLVFYMESGLRPVAQGFADTLRVTDGKFDLKIGDI